MGQNYRVNSSVVKGICLDNSLKTALFRPAVYQDLIAIGRFHENRVALSHIQKTTFKPFLVSASAAYQTKIAPKNRVPKK